MDDGHQESTFTEFAVMQSYFCRLGKYRPNLFLEGQPPVKVLSQVLHRAAIRDYVYFHLHPIWAGILCLVSKMISGLLVSQIEAVSPHPCCTLLMI